MSHKSFMCTFNILGPPFLREIVCTQISPYFLTHLLPSLLRVNCKSLCFFIPILCCTFFSLSLYNFNYWWVITEKLEVLYISVVIFQKVNKSHEDYGSTQFRYPDLLPLYLTITTEIFIVFMRGTLGPKFAAVRLFFPFT